MDYGKRAKIVIILCCVGFVISISGCKKEEPLNKKEKPREPYEERLYKQTKIAFASKRDGNTEIYVMNTEGGEQKRLTNNPALERYPSWSPDGKKIAFESISSRRSIETNSDIYVMNSDGTEQTRLTNNPRIDGYPSWSLDCYPKTGPILVRV